MTRGTSHRRRDTPGGAPTFLRHSGQPGRSDANPAPNQAEGEPRSESLLPGYCSTVSVGISSTPTGPGRLATRWCTSEAISGLHTCSGIDGGMKSGTDMLLMVIVIGTQSRRCAPT